MNGKRLKTVVVYDMKKDQLWITEKSNKDNYQYILSSPKGRFKPIFIWLKGLPKTHVEIGDFE